MKRIFLAILVSYLNPAHSQNIWGPGVLVESPRENIYSLNNSELARAVENGKRHALIYPVTSTELAIPFWPLKNVFESTPDSKIRKFLFDISKTVSPFKKMDDFYYFLGLHDYPKEFQWQNPNTLPKLTEEELTRPMGATIMDTPHGDALTFSCAACHIGDLFGVKVLGMTNRFPRANDFFNEGQRLAPFISTYLFKEVANTTEGEREMLVMAKRSLRYVGAKKPEAIGLDTSLAQIALSLAKRDQDEFATRGKHSYRVPRKSILDKKIADSKPAVWWNLKYKNRWLSDGSIISGNPVFTNLLWNEIGRGADLVTLEKWMIENEDKIKELTAAVFATKPPRYEDFFGVEKIDIQKAQRGQVHFEQSCKRCHGSYQKGWNSEESHLMNPSELVQTTKVTYHKTTPVRNVGTDPGRYEGMKAFAFDLNKLQISKTLNAIVIPQKGYVPPPLDGIWARWPYFHNNSIPNLCELLTPASKRTRTYWSGHPIDRDTDFDQNCVGYPIGNKTPENWKKNQDHFYDTNREGMGNQGHDEGIFLRNGKEIYTQIQKQELIEYLKTL